MKVKKQNGTKSNKDNPRKSNYYTKEETSKMHSETIRVVAEKYKGWYND